MMCFAVELSKAQRKILVAMRLGGTPVPIPNTTVKTQAADGTAHERGRAGGRQMKKKNPRTFTSDPKAWKSRAVGWLMKKQGKYSNCYEETAAKGVP